MGLFEDLSPEINALKAYVAASDEPYLFTSPRDAGLLVLSEALAELRYGLRDAVALIPARDEHVPTQGETLKGIALDMAIDYPQYEPKRVEAVVYSAFMQVQKHFRVVDARSSEPQEVSRRETERERISEHEERIHYDVQYEWVETRRIRLAKDSKEVGRDMVPALLLLGTEEPDWAFFMDLWARLGAVPKAGSAQSRSALMLLLSHFEVYLRNTVLAAVAQGSVDVDEDAATKVFREVHERNAGFDFYQKWLRSNLGTDFIESMREPQNRRNLFVHHGGIAHQRYVDRFPSTGVRAGYPVPLNREYLLGVADAAAQVANHLTGLLLSRAQQGKGASA